jgi:hypothetical protein
MTLLRLFKRWRRCFRPALFRPEPICTLTLREPNGMLANYILDTLRRWHKQSGYGDMLILKSEDIEALAKWAAEIQKAHEETVWWAPTNRFGVKQLPQPIRTY